MMVRLGIIGFGIMGERLLRTVIAQDPPLLDLIGVWDPSSAAQDRLQSELPDVPILQSAAAVIEASDCVYIASPPDSHIAHAQAAFAAGRAVLCEKPLSSDTEASRAFVDAAESAGERAAVNFVFASSPAVAQLEDWLAQGRIGEIQKLEIEIGFAAWPRPWQMAAASWLSKRADGGFTREVISHFLFLTRRQLGPLALQNHQVTYPEGDLAEVSVSGELRAGSTPVSITGGVGTTDKADHNIWCLTGTNGSIRLRDWSIAEFLNDRDEWQEAPDALPNELARPLILQGQLKKLIQLTNGQPQSLATLREALEVQEIVERLLTER